MISKKGARLVRAMKRRDKFQLAGGKVMFAPRYPHWLGAPGFWDGVWYHDEELQPVFTYALLGEGGGPVELRFERRLWQPGVSRSRYRPADSLAVEETRFITPDDRVASRLLIRDTTGRARTLDLVLWTSQPNRQDLSQAETTDATKRDVRRHPSVDEVSFADGALRFRRTDQGRRSVFATRWRMGADIEPDSFLVIDAERAGPDPRWELTPFHGGWNGGLPSQIVLSEKDSAGVRWFALHYRWALNPGERKEITLQMRIAAEGEGEQIEHSPGAGPDMLESSRLAWDDFFADTPELRCSEPRWEHLFRYRWYLLRQNYKSGGHPRQPLAGFCEGPQMFHQPVSYSTPPILFELRWHADPAFARDHFFNFCRLQEESGRFSGALFHDRRRAEFFYHADWGRAFELLHYHHPNEAFLRLAYPHLARYGEWLMRERDREGSGMIDIVSHFETGQEFNSRYLAAGADFDTETWQENIRFKGVDSTSYALLLWRALRRAAAAMGLAADAERWRGAFERSRAALLGRMWQEKEGMFSDLIPGAGDFAPTQVGALTNFYPYLCGIVGGEHVARLRETLLNPRRFRTPYPAATLSLEDPDFSADGNWRGKVRNCPWNGRVWPMTNSHIIEALAESSKLDASLRKPCAEMLDRFASLFCDEGDPKLVSSHEHYHPLTGRPPLQRGIDDYLHCWVIDLIIRFVAGFRPEGDFIYIDPLVQLPWLELSGIWFRCNEYKVCIESGRASLVRNGRLAAEGEIPLRAELEK